MAEFNRTFILWIYYNIVKAPRMSYIAFLHILSQLVFEVWHLEFLRDYLQGKGFLAVLETYGSVLF